MADGPACAGLACYTGEMRRLGIDHGKVRIGLALSDEEGRLALPHRTVTRRGKALAEVIAEIAAEAARAEVREIVVGLPLDMEGTEGDAARHARAFARHLEKAVEAPLVLWDERLTTVAAERSLREIGVRGRARKDVVDQSAAALLLQSYLDAQADTSWDDEQIEAFVATEEDPAASRRRRGGRRRGPSGRSKRRGRGGRGR